MQAKQGAHLFITGIATLAYKAFVFFDTFAVFISIGDLVAKATTQANIAERPFHLVETAVATGRRGMMVDDSGAAGTCGIHQGQQGRVINVL